MLKCVYISGDGKENDGGDWKVIRHTEKTLILKRIREPFFEGIDDDILRLKKIIIANIL